MNRSSIKRAAIELIGGEGSGGKRLSYDGLEGPGRSRCPKIRSAAAKETSPVYGGSDTATGLPGGVSNSSLDLGRVGEGIEKGSMEGGGSGSVNKLSKVKTG